MAMLSPHPKAKVFISCGQKEDSTERHIATEIEQKLIDLGYDTYLAFQQHTLKGLKENIFYHLADSEYFLFIDFKREQLANLTSFRGSLYANQELAISSFLEKEVIAFQQTGVARLDGMLLSLQLNPIQFRDDEIKDLPNLVEEHIKHARWNSQWKNALDASVHASFHDAPKVDGGIGRHYFLKIANLHKDKIAVNCTAYVKSIISTKNNRNQTSETVELKWSGSRIPSVAIMPQSYRLLDAFFVLHSHPSILLFSSYSDSLIHLPPLKGIADYEITYVIVPDNFPLTEKKTSIRISGNIDTILFASDALLTSTEAHPLPGADLRRDE